MHLGAVNCIYDDGTVFAMEAGPCQDVLDSGAYLVDAVTEETSIDVTTPYPRTNWLPLVLAAGALLMLSGRR